MNLQRKGYPNPSASINNKPDSLYQAIDGRIWYFAEISNRWTTEGSKSDHDWFAIDFGKPREISNLNIYPYVDAKRFGLPSDMLIEYKSEGKWILAKIESTNLIVGNARNVVSFQKVKATEVRIRFVHTEKNIAVGEIQIY